MKLKDFIKKLNKIEKEYSGELPVVLSSDEEGNSFGTTNIEWSFGVGESDVNDNTVCIIIYPYESNFDDYEEAAKRG